MEPRRGLPGPGEPRRPGLPGENRSPLRSDTRHRRDDPHVRTRPGTARPHPRRQLIARHWHVPTGIRHGQARAPSRGRWCSVPARKGDRRGRPDHPRRPQDRLAGKFFASRSHQRLCSSSILFASYRAAMAPGEKLPVGQGRTSAGKGSLWRERHSMAFRHAKRQRPDNQDRNRREQDQTQDSADVLTASELPSCCRSRSAWSRCWPALASCRFSVWHVLAVQTGPHGHLHRGFGMSLHVYRRPGEGTGGNDLPRTPSELRE